MSGRAEIKGTGNRSEWRGRDRKKGRIKRGNNELK